MDICKTERLKGGLEIGGIGNCKPFFYRSLVHNGLPNETLPNGIISLLFFLRSFTQVGSSEKKLPSNLNGVLHVSHLKCFTDSY